MNLNKERKAWIVERMAFKEELSKIKEDYSRLFEDTGKDGKMVNAKITGEELIQFREDNRLAIESYARKELNNVKKEPLAHARIRLRILNDALTHAMTPQPVKSVIESQSGRDIEYKISYAPDYAAIANIVRSAQAEEFFIKKLFLDIKKLELDPKDLGSNAESGFDIIPVDTGLRQIEAS